MGSGKNFRQEKRMPTCYVIATAVAFVAMCLLGAWVLRSPSGSRLTVVTQSVSVDVKETFTSKSDATSNETFKDSITANEVFEDSAGDLSLENEEKVAEALKQQSDESTQSKSDESTESKNDVKKESFEALTEKREEKPVEKKETEKSSADVELDKTEESMGSSPDVMDVDVGSTEKAVDKSEKNIESDNAGQEQSERLIKSKVTSNAQKSESNKEEKLGQSGKEKEKSDDQSAKGHMYDETSGSGKKNRKKAITEDLEEDDDEDEISSPNKKITKKGAAQDMEEDDDADETSRISKKKAATKDLDVDDDEEEADETSRSSKKSSRKDAAKDLNDDDDADETSRASKIVATKAASQGGNNIRQRRKIEWALCEFDGATDYIPCLDNAKAIKALPSNKHYEHRERHCPDQAPTCLVPLPDRYRTPIRWPQSRNEVRFANVPHPGLVSYKKDQNWVKKTNDRLIFPGGGTQFKRGALHYIDYLEQSFPKIAWGKHIRVILDVGCGVASLGGYMFDREVVTFSFAPKDEHEAQVQLALERGIPAISSVMGTQRLVFPSNVYDAVHCARCRVPWHIEGGKLLLELNRILRPGGYFIWSATPVYWTGEEDVETWRAMVKLTKAMCWKLVAKFTDASAGIGAAIFQKPTSNYCYENRNKGFPPMCDEDDKADAAWYIPMTACIHRIPDEDERGAEWPQEWPLRLTEAPTWLSNRKGAYSKTAAKDFLADTERWQRAVQKSYLQGLGIEWKNIRNVMDMRATYGGFAAALSSLPVWVMNVVPYDAPDTLPVIFDRGLLGIYHDWCESFSSYPRTYDLLHADHLFSKLKNRCNLKGVIAEVDRLLRPGGWIIVRDSTQSISQMQDYFESLQWEIRMTLSKGEEGLLGVQKTKWRPESSF